MSGHLVVAAVVQLVHGVENPALHGFEAVVEVRHRPLEDHVAGVIEEIVRIHRAERGMLVGVVGHRGGCLKGMRRGKPGMRAQTRCHERECQAAGNSKKAASGITGAQR